MAAAIQQNQVGLQQIVTKADAELLSIQAQLDQAQKEVISKAAELEAISSRTATRDQQLHIAGQSVATVKEELAQLRLRVDLAQGTLSSDNCADQIKTLSTRLLRLEKEQHDLLVKLTKEASTDANREAAIRTAIDQAQELITSLHKEQETTHQARQSAFNDLGQLQKQVVMSKLKELHENITRMRTEAASAVQALDAYADEG